MLTLESVVSIPASVLSTTVEQDVVLLNTETSQYYSLDEVGARFWNLLGEGVTLKQAHQTLLKEYEVEAAELESDLLELLEDFQKNGLVEITDP